MTNDLAALLAEHDGPVYGAAKVYCHCGELVWKLGQEVLLIPGMTVGESAHLAHQAALIAETFRRAVIEELIAKAETGPTDGTNDPHAAYWLRAELDGEG